MSNGENKNWYDQKIEKMNLLTQKVRGVILGPILRFLAKFKITANFISSVKIFLMLPYFYLIDKYFNLAIGILIFAMILDLFDGPIARYTNSHSDRGKFFDIFGDHVVYCGVILSLIYLNLVNGFLGAYQIFIVGILYLLAVIKRNESIKSDWIIRPYAQSSYYKIIFYFVFALAVFLKIDVLDSTLYYLNILMTVVSIYYYLVIVTRNRVIE